MEAEAVDGKTALIWARSVGGVAAISENSAVTLAVSGPWVLAAVANTSPGTRPKLKMRGLRGTACNHLADFSVAFHSKLDVKGWEACKEISIVPNKKSWPDQKNLGFPLNPKQTGPHLVKNKYGYRYWGWWDSRRCIWNIRAEDVSAYLAGTDMTYVGPAQAPDGKPI